MYIKRPILAARFVLPIWFVLLGFAADILGSPLPRGIAPGRNESVLQQAGGNRLNTSEQVSPQALFAKGQAALQAGDLAGAEAAFRSVLELDPRSGAAYSNLGVIAMRRKDWDHALVLLQ
jgi:tetratricopeptide (TPR) repeat protein